MKYAINGTMIATLFVSAANCLIAPAKSQVLEAAGVAATVAGPVLMKKSVKTILSDAQLTANTVLAEANRTGNSLMIRGGDELNVLITNADNIFADRLDKTLEKIEGPERKLLESIAAAQDTAKGLADKAYTAKDTAVLDVAGILGSIPFVAERFTIQRVGGLTQLEKSAPYQMPVIGSYVGTAGTGPRTSLKLKIAGKDVPNLASAPSEVHRTTLSIPNSVLAPLFKKGEIAIVDADLVAEIVTPTTFLFFFPSEKRQTVTNRLHLVLYPAYAGDAQLTVSTPKLGWKAISDDSTTATGPNAHCSSGCSGSSGVWFEFSKAVPGGERIPQKENDIRIVEARCEQVAPGNPFDYGKKVYISDSASRATCGFYAHTHAQAYELSFKREQWLPKDDAVVATPVKLYYDKATAVTIPKERSNIKIEGKVLTGESFLQFVDVVDPNSPVQVVNKVENANDATLYIQARRPSTLD